MSYGIGSAISIALKVIAIVVIVIAIVVAASAVLPVLSGGIAALKAGTVTLIGFKGGAAVVLSALKAAAVSTAIAGVVFFGSGAFSNQIVLPLYSISPEEIFRNKIPVFDVNFVNPNSNPVNSKWADQITLADGQKAIEEARTNNGEYRSREEGETFPSVQEVKNYGTKYEGDDAKKYYNVSQGNQVFPYGSLVYIYIKDGKEYMVKSEPGNGYQGFIDSDVMIKVDKTSNTSSNTNSNSNTNDANGEVYQIFGISYILQNTIAKWYHNLRIIAIVGMMSVLVYIGIRITISSASEQKAKYKELLKDWFVGMVLLFTMHYIMNFSNVAVYRLTEMFNSVNPYQMVPIFEDNIGGVSGKVQSTLDEYDIPPEKDGKVLWATVEDENGKYVEWHTNLMGAIRMKAEARKEDGTDEAFIGYSLMFVVMVIYTISFCWVYLRRVVYMAFLTLIAPLVALTYPIDKVNDGHAQGFNYWFKEYIFNLLIQPIHLLIYTILVSSAAELALNHWIYALVVLGFLVSAEKILRKMFNFRAENAPGLMSGPIAAGLTMTGMRWLMGHGPKANQNKGNSGEDSKNNISPTNETKMRDLLKDTTTTNDSVANKPTGSKSVISANNVLDDDITSTELLDNLMSDLSSSSSSGSVSSSLGSSSSLSSGSASSSSSSSVSRSSSGLSSGKKIGRWQGFKNGFSNMSSRYISDKRNKILQDAREGKSLKALTKGAIGVAGGATLGALGLAAGVASGEPSKAFQNAAIGAAGGFKLASGMGSYAADNLDFEGLAEAYGRGAMGTEAYDLKQAEKYAKEYASRKDVISTVQKKSKENSWSKSAEKTQELAKVYGVGEGFYDAGLWMKFEKMQDKIRHDSGNRISIAEARKQAVASKKIHDNFYDKTKSRKEIEKAMMDSMKIDESQARIMSKAMYDWNEILN